MPPNSGQSVVPEYSWMCHRPEVWSVSQGLATQSYRKLTFSLQKLIAAGSPWLGLGCCASSPSMFGFGSALASPSLMHIATTTVSSYVQLPCCVQRTLFPWCHPPPLALILFLSLLPQGPLNHGRKVSVCFTTQQFFFLFFFY